MRRITQLALVQSVACIATPPRQVVGNPQISTGRVRDSDEAIQTHNVFSFGSAEIHSKQELLKYVKCHQGKEHNNFQI